MEPTVQALIALIKQKVPILTDRSPAAAADYLEVVLAHQEMPACYDALSEVLGPPIKTFGKGAKFEPKIQKAVDRLGGIRLEQCLFLKAVAPQQMMYAALWPWASDATRLTLKVGVVNV